MWIGAYDHDEEQHTEVWELAEKVIPSDLMETLNKSRFIDIKMSVVIGQ